MIKNTSNIFFCVNGYFIHSIIHFEILYKIYYLITFYFQKFVKFECINNYWMYFLNLPIPVVSLWKIWTYLASWKSWEADSAHNYLYIVLGMIMYCRFKKNDSAACCPNSFRCKVTISIWSKKDPSQFFIIIYKYFCNKHWMIKISKKLVCSSFITFD